MCPRSPPNGHEGVRSTKTELLVLRTARRLPGSFAVIDGYGRSDSAQQPVGTELIVRQGKAREPDRSKIFTADHADRRGSRARQAPGGPGEGSGKKTVDGKERGPGVGL